ncbi:hypothetical protein [Rhizobium leguminosarum]|uniref:Uncharacterized protein n=1 Tax=Rhizobium leguminosarum TaxID=384 RepID=A0A2K9ZD02_RHILE|nr:hypothetical protein [Rhizobium leguminosarum]AUW46125.1 hypothetical protein CUJ84_pRLN1000669 [Rhizobium leguminosarum]
MDYQRPVEACQTMMSVSVSGDNSERKAMHGYSRASSSSIAAPFIAIIAVGVLVLQEVIVGMIDA